jgi:hypothetical protein
MANTNIIGREQEVFRAFMPTENTGISGCASCRQRRHGGGCNFAEPGLAFVQLRKRLHPDCRKDVLPAVDPIVPLQASHGVRPPHTRYPLRLRIEVLDHGGDIGCLRRDLNHRIGPIEVLFELGALRRVSKDDGAPGGALEQA